jgi:hypothetical protein
VCLTDKNLGPAILEHRQYILQVHKDHLGHTNTYKRLTKSEAKDLLASTSCSLRLAYCTHSDDLPHAKRTYFDQGLKKPHTEYRVPQFFITPKVHKIPWSTCPVVSCVGSFAEIFSKWLDHQMKKLLPTFSKRTSRTRSPSSMTSETLDPRHHMPNSSQQTWCQCTQILTPYMPWTHSGNGLQPFQTKYPQISPKIFFYWSWSLE